MQNEIVHEAFRFVCVLVLVLGLMVALISEAE